MLDVGRPSNYLIPAKAGDLIVVYVKNPVSAVVGIYRATSSYYEDHSEVWPDGEYAIRVKIERYSDCNVPFRELIAKGIRLASNKKLSQAMQLHTEIMKLEKEALASFVMSHKALSIFNMFYKYICLSLSDVYNLISRFFKSLKN